MAKGGTTKSVSISKPGAGVVKETKGDTNQKMGIYGIAQTGPTGPNNSGIATMKKGGTKKEHPITAFRKANEARDVMVKKSLPKAQLGTIVKTVAKFLKPTAKPVAKSIIKDIKVVARPVNRTANPVAKKLDPKIVRKTLNDSRQIKQLNRGLKSDRKIAKVALGVGSTATAVGTGAIIDAMTDKKAKAKTKKK
jgi:hypothetical protein